MDQIFQWIKVGFCLSRLIRFRPSSIDDNETDMLICTGHSNEVRVYHNGEVGDEKYKKLYYRKINSCHRKIRV